MYVYDLICMYVCMYVRPNMYVCNNVVYCVNMGENTQHACLLADIYI